MVDFGSVASALTDKIFSGILWFGIVAVIILALAGAMYYFLVYKRKFDIDIKITSKRARDRDYIIFDRGAILSDRKSGAKYLKLWVQKKELKLPTFNILQRTNKGDYLELLRTGEDQWYYLLPTRIDKKYGVKADGSYYPLAEQSTKAIDPEMEYWSAKRKGMNKKMFDQDTLIAKLLPYIPLLLGGVFIIFVLWILMSKLPAILSQLQELTIELNRRQIAEVTTGLWMSLI